MNIMLIIVSLVLFLCSVSGLIAGFLKKASGLLSFILAGMLVTALLPTVTGWLRNGRNSKEHHRGNILFLIR